MLRKNYKFNENYKKNTYNDLKKINANENIFETKKYFYTKT